MERIVATAPIDPAAIEILEKKAPVETAPAQDEKTLLAYCRNTIAFVSRGNGAVTGPMIERSDDLKVIGRPGAGYDTVDIESATKRNIPVVYAPVGTFAVAEGALALMLSLVKKLPECDRIVKSDNWKQRFQLTTGDMTGHTVGIIGFGRIGSQLAKLLQPFQLSVLVYDPYIAGEKAAEYGAELVDLNELLAKSDYITLHIPLNKETRGMINAEKVNLIKEGAILINTARGDLIENLDVIADALDSGRLSAAGMDVFPSEPPDVSHRIFKHPNFICAPHLVGVSALAMNRIYTSMANDMVTVLEGGRPAYCVNPQVFS